MHSPITRLAVIALVSLGSGCSNPNEPSGETSTSLVVTGEEKCGDAVEFTFGNDVAAAELDRAIGPRVEKYELIHGPRVRVEGTARRTRTPSLSIDSAEPFAILIWGEFKWPTGAEGRHVVGEGSLSRCYYPASAPPGHF